MDHRFLKLLKQQSDKGNGCYLLSDNLKDSSQRMPSKSEQTNQTKCYYGNVIILYLGYFQYRLKLLLMSNVKYCTRC